MSKMGQLNIELSEQAAELGFESIDEAEQAGYGIDWNAGKLVEPQELAHEAWLKEREEVLGGLINLMVHSAYDYGTVIKAYNFIKEQCHD